MSDKSDEIELPGIKFSCSRTAYADGTSPWSLYIEVEQDTEEGSSHTWNHLSEDDAMELRDWLNTNLPPMQCDCWERVTALIKPGKLQGNGVDQTAKRNGIILAANTILPNDAKLRRD